MSCMTKWCVSVMILWLSLTVVVPGGASTYISSSIYTSSTWTLAGSPYLVTTGIEVKSTTASQVVVLTIEPGVIVKFVNSYSRITFGANSSERGGLIAQGNSVNGDVIFTSYKNDAAGGDTNGDGTASSPAPGDWDNLYISAYSFATMERCQVSYGSHNIYLYSSTVSLTSTVISSSGGKGIYVDYGCYPVISNCQFYNNQDYPISIAAEGVRNITGCTYSSGTVTNKRQGIEVRGDTIKTSCTWKNQGIPYVLTADVNVYSPSPGSVLNIETGSILKLAYNYVEINTAGSSTTEIGGLTATGVIFTSLNDDAVGGDTYGDGTTTSPAYDDWYGLIFNRYTIASTKLDKCIIRYGGNSPGGMIYLTACSPTFTACTINYSGEHGIYGVSNAYPTISNCRFESNQDYPISIQAEGIRKVTGNTFSNNVRQGIEVKSDLVHTSCSWTNQGVPYVIDGNLSIYTSGNGCMLTLNSGLIWKFAHDYVQVYIAGSSTTEKGGLIATGVAFTSINDDAIGGDTYADGTATTPSYDDWYSLNFDRYTIASTKLDKCIVRYGGNTPGGMIYLTACSPTFSYCTINYSGEHGIYGTGNSYPTISTCRFDYNQDYPISLQAEGIRKVTGNSFSNNKRSGIEVKGDIVITTCTWTNQGVPYVISADVSVYTTGSGSILTLNSGVVCKFSYQYAQLNIGGDVTTKQGGLIATGVTFTSLQDDSIGGDTYGDGTATSPAPGDWECLYFDRYALATTKLDRCVVKYGGYTYNAEVYALGCAPTFSYCTIDYSYEHGIYGTSKAYPTVSNCAFRNNQDYPVSLEAEGIRKVTGCSFSSNKRSGIEVKDDIVITSGTWTNQGVPYVVAGDVSIYTTGNGCILTLNPSVVLKFAYLYGQLNVGGDSTTKRGGLIATGVTFTSIKDDSIGGDTYGDGTATIAASGDWECLYFDRYALSTTKLDRCIIKYGGNTYSGEVYAIACSPTFSYCTVDYSKEHGIYALSNGYPTVSNCVFRYNQDYPVSIEAEGIRKVTNSSISNNNRRPGIEVKNDIVITSGTWANQGVPYVIEQTVSIHTTGSGCTLTLNPGVILKFAYTYGIFEAGDPHTDQYGGLIAIGSVNAPIYFTSIDDDSIGGDTYGDGTASSPAPGNWLYIYTSYYTLPSSVFDHCIIRYAQDGIHNASQATLNVRYCLIEKNSNYGIYTYYPLYGELHHNTIINNLLAGIWIQIGNPPVFAYNNLCQNPIGLLANGSYVQFNYNNISKNTTYGAQNKVTTYTIPGEFNWWGDMTGPYDGSTVGLYNPLGKGDTVSNYIDYDPWLRENPEQPRRLPDIKLLKGYQQDEVLDLDRYILDTAASFTWSTNPSVNQARVVINADNTVDYTLSRTTAFVGIDSVSYCANWYAKSTSMLKYSTYIFDHMGDAIVDNGNEIENCWLDLRDVIIKDPSTAYPTIYKSTTIYDDASDAARLSATLSGSTVEILSSSALKSPATIIFTVQKDSTGTDYDKQLIRVYEIVNSNGHFNVASDTTKWYFQVYSDGTGPGTLSFVTGYSDGSGVARILQVAGQKGKFSQLFTVPKPGWYTARARIATDMTLSSKQQKVYLYLQEYNSSNQIVEVANQVLSTGAGAFTGPGVYRDIEISYYAKGTSLGVQVVAINPSGSGVTGSIYIDNIWVYPAAPKVTRSFGASQVDIVNASFDTATTGWLVEVYSDGTGPGTWSWDTGWAGRTGILKVNQVGGEKGKASQLFTFPSKQRNASASVWVYSNATSSANAQKVYLYLYSYDAGYTKVVESGNAILQPGVWVPNQWRELKFGYTPLTAINAVQVVAINQAGKPTANIYFDDISVNQEQDISCYWDHTLF